MGKKDIYSTIYHDALTRYTNRYIELGESPQALGWGGKEDQIERFRVMVENLDFNGKTVMDIGCGFADFYAYLKERNIECRYIGVDIIPEFLSCAAEKFPEAEFIQNDFMLESDRLSESDVVVTNGTLNYKQKKISNLEYTEDFMRLALKKARDAVVMDFLSTQLTPDYPKEDLVFYHNPAEMINMAFHYTSNVKLIHNYRAIPQKEFMLFMYKDKIEG